MPPRPFNFVTKPLHSATTNLAVVTVAGSATLITKIIIFSAFSMGVGIYYEHLLTQIINLASDQMIEMTVRLIINIVDRLYTNLADLLNHTNTIISNADIEYLTRLHGYLTPFLRHTSSLIELLLRIGVYLEQFTAPPLSGLLTDSIARYHDTYTNFMQVYRFIEDLLGIARENSPIEWTNLE